MEESKELRSILPYLPLRLLSSSLFWPSQAAETLSELAGGRVDSGHQFFQAISRLRSALSLSSEPFSPSTSLGYSVFFDEVTLLFSLTFQFLHFNCVNCMDLFQVMSPEESRKWFQEVVPVLANLLLRLPSLLETHYQNPNNAMPTTTALRLLDTQETGIVFLSQVTFLNVTLLCFSL